MIDAYIEHDCTFDHEGRRFTSGGTNCRGDQIGTCVLASSWRVHNYIGSHMHQIYATIEGVKYTGRGFGEGMIVNLRRCAKQ